MSDLLWLHDHPDLRAAAVRLVEEGLAAQCAAAPGNGGAPPALALVEEQALWYDTLAPRAPLRGRAAVAAVARWLRGALPDLSIRVTEIASAEGGHALLYYKAEGTHLGDLNWALGGGGGRSGGGSGGESSGGADAPVAATGKAVAWTGSVVLRFAPCAASGSGGDGSSGGWRVAAAWHSWDPLFMFEQIGLTPAPEVVPAAPEAAPAAPAAPATAEGTGAGSSSGGGGGSAAAAAAGAPAAAAGAPAAAAAAAGEGGSPDEWKAVVRQYFDVYNTGKRRLDRSCAGSGPRLWHGKRGRPAPGRHGDFERLPQIVDPSYRYWGLIDLGGRQGVVGMAAMMGGWRDALAEFEIGADWLVAAEGGRVLFRWVLQGLHTKAPLRGVPAPAPGGPPRQIWSCGVTALSITAAAGASQTPNTAAAAAAAAPTGDEEVVAAPPGASGRIWRKVSHANGAELLRQLGVFGRGVAVPPELLA